MKVYSRWYHWKNVGSQVLNVLLGGHHDLTVSAESWLRRDEPFRGALCAWADALLGAGHCRAAWDRDAEYACEIITRRLEDARC